MKNLVLSQRAFAEMHYECFKHPQVETGGILVGAGNAEDIIVPFTLGSGPAAYRSSSRFEPDVAWQQERLEQYFEKYGINYVGSFHRHPGRLSRPSSIDYCTAVRILFDPDWAVDESVFPIILLKGRKIVIYPYYMCRKRLKFELMTMFMVPDDHVLLKRITKKDKKNENGGFRRSDCVKQKDVVG
jgi:integrative and conjugative element protein (TIGR02256 family)